MPKINEKFSRLADQATIDKVVKVLREKGVRVDVVKNYETTHKKIFNLIPEGAEVMNMASTSLEQLGVDKIILESGKFKAVREMFKSLDNKKQKMEMKRLGAAQAWAIGSVQALTEDGAFMISSATGSQLPAYAYGADHLLWVIGAQKIVKNLKEGFDRIYKYCFPLENKRALKVYGDKSSVSKILIIDKELIPGRLNVIIVKKKLGF